MAKTTAKTPKTTLTGEAPIEINSLKDSAILTLEQLRSTLTSRGVSYGSFFDNSAVAIKILIGAGIIEQDKLEHIIWLLSEFDKIPEENAPALAMLLMNAKIMVQEKISRIAQSPAHEDSWLDLAGYAILAHAAIRMKKAHI